MHSNRPVQPPGCRINASSSVHPPRRGWSVPPDGWSHPCAGSRRLGRPAANSSRAPGDLGERHVHPQEAGLDGAWHQCLELWGRSEDVFRSVHLLHDIEPRPGDPAAARASRIHCVETTSIAQHNGVPQADRERSWCARPPSRPRHPRPPLGSTKWVQRGDQPKDSTEQGATANRDRFEQAPTPFEESPHFSQPVSGNVRMCQCLTR
jgi:hypothetical protein